MKIGVLGGTFDPIHNGHIAIARQAAEEFGLERVVLMVAADPPHKHHENMLPGADRLKLAKAAAAPYEDELLACDLELQRGGKSYSVDTMGLLRERWPGVDWYMIVGGDMLKTLPDWYQARRLMELTGFLGVPRPDTQGDYRAMAEALRRDYGARVELASFAGPDLSSTMVRQRVQKALPIEDMVPPRVERMIYEEGYYFPDSLRRMQEKLRCAQNEERYRHTMGTVRTAIALASRYGEDGEKARLAALLHDCGKVQGQDILRQAAEAGIPAQAKYRGLLHAPVGVEYAKRRYGITDPEVLGAIRWHATGRPGMSRLEKIIYLADTIEPNRDFPGVERLREASAANLDRAVTLAARESIREVKQRGKPLHPATVATLRWLVGEEGKQAEPPQ